jgi:hypothetical protein
MRCDSCSFRQHNVLTRLQRLGEEASRRRLRVSSPDGTMRGGRRIACGGGIPHGMSDPNRASRACASWAFTRSLIKLEICSPNRGSAGYLRDGRECPGYRIRIMRRPSLASLIVSRRGQGLVLGLG